MDTVERIREFLVKLTVGIGPRVAGSAQDQAAVELIVGTLAGLGLAARIETFPVLSRWMRRQSLEVETAAGWRAVPCSLLSSVPGTSGLPREAPLVFFSAATDYQGEDLSHLRGKAVVHFGGHIENRDAYRRLMQAGPAFLLFADVRHPGEVPLADGMFPAYTAELGGVPTLNVPFMAVWRWQQEGATRARICVDGGMTPASSCNICVDFPGSEPGAGWLYAGAHYDSQADSPGADDDGSGTAVILEMARQLRSRRHRRGIRLILFGAEEQLSVGSAIYVRRHREEIGREGRFMLNFDSCGARLGWYAVNGNGPDAMFAAVTESFRRQGRYLKVSRECIPYTDQFPFAVCGVPGVWVRRCCTASGVFWHHRPDDTLDNLSCAELALQSAAGSELLLNLADAAEFPFGAGIPAPQRDEMAARWDDLYGGW